MSCAEFMHVHFGGKSRLQITKRWHRGQPTKQADHFAKHAESRLGSTAMQQRRREWCSGAQNYCIAVDTHVGSTAAQQRISLSQQMT